MGCFGEVEGEHEFCGGKGREARVRKVEEERKKGGRRWLDLVEKVAEF